VENEIVQEIQGIEITEQLQIIHTAKVYLNEYILPDIRLDPNWVSGYAMKNQINVSYGDEPIYKCNMEVFYQEKGSLQRKKVFEISLVRFANEGWLVFQVKENNS
jgi:hypothetical protein